MNIGSIFSAILFLIIMIDCTAQSPISQVEGFLEVYHPQDTTSIYIGKKAGQGVGQLIRFNTFLGAYAGAVNTGKSNSFFGSESGSKNTTGTNNCFYGSMAGRDNSIGHRNSYFGNASGIFDTIGFGNSYFGHYSGYFTQGGLLNSFFGSESGTNNNTGDYNSFFGGESGYSNTSGISNSFFGNESGHDNTTGNFNCFYGAYSGASNTLASQNSFFGYASGISNEAGWANSFFGYQSGNNNRGGKFNSYFGANTGLYNITGDNNNFFGVNAGMKTTTGENNNFYGVYSGQENTSGWGNSFFGYCSGINSSIGQQNSFFGNSAGFENGSGSFNSFFGDDSGRNNQNSEGNSFFGEGSGRFNRSGSYNSFFGVAAGANILGSNNIIIGALAGAVDTSTIISNSLFIDVNQSNSPLIYGEFDNNLVEINGRFEVDAPNVDGQIYLTLNTERGWSFRQYGFGSSTALRLTGADQNNNNKNFLIDTDGNVGIDFNQPNAKLHVGGNIIATGTIMGSSDINRKEVFVNINSTQILEKVANLEITEWQFKDSGDRHIGPMSQDFYNAFGLGKDDKTIATVDADGIALAAIQALYQENKLLKMQVLEMVERISQFEQKFKSKIVNYEEN